MSSWKYKFGDFFFAPSSGRVLSLLRIVIGCSMLAEAFLLFPFLKDLYGPFGYLQADVIEALTGKALPGIAMAAGISADTYTTFLYGFYICHILICLCFLVGFQGWLMGFVLWFSQTILMNSGYFSSYGIDRYYHNLLFLMMWFPITEYWSVDSWRAKAAPMPSGKNKFALRLVQIFLLLTYADAGLSKAMGTDWWDGEAIWRVLNQPGFHQFDFLWLANYPWFNKLASRGTIFVEALYGIGVWFPYLGSAWVLAIMSLHIGIAFTMGLKLFGITLAFIHGTVFLLNDNK